MGEGAFDEHYTSARHLSNVGITLIHMSHSYQVKINLTTGSHIAATT